jgi:hypothetical protein
MPAGAGGFEAARESPAKATYRVVRSATAAAVARALRSRPVASIPRATVITRWSYVKWELA